MEKKWVKKSAPNQEIIIRLIEQVGVSRVLATLMAQRGIENFDEARAFFRPTLEELYDPFLMKNMEAAVERIEMAIAHGENILIYGDYDVDGTTAVALMHEYLTQSYEQIGYYIPDRYTEGYGISQTGVDFAIDNSFSLVIALDCGIKALKEISYAKNNSVDFIVCDHHLPGQVLPKCIVLNPKQNECNYPFKELSGCGVGFKLAQALQLYRNQPFQEIIPLLDLVAVSIAADLVAITDENRILTYFGLKQLNENPRVGLKQLKMTKKQSGPFTVSDVVFSIAPKINAAGRIESGNQAVELLLANQYDEVEDISERIVQHNATRKGLDQEITEQALGLFEEDSWLLNAKSTVVYNADWHKGVIGIVASRLIEKYYRPTIVLTESNGVAVGSARSIKGFNIYEALVACDDLLTQYGGHKYAAGLTLPIENIPALKLKLNALAQEKLTDEMFVPEIEVDCEIDFRDIYEHERGVAIPKFYRILKQLGPFGPGNPSPIFLTKGVIDSGQTRVLAGGEHVKLAVYQPDFPDIKLYGIGFGLGKLYQQLESKRFDIVYTLTENYWQNNVSLQMTVKDIRPSDPIQ